MTTNDTPSVGDLLDYWCEMVAKDQLVTFGPDRGALLLAYITELEDERGRLSETIQFNRRRTEERDTEKNVRIAELYDEIRRLQALLSEAAA